MSHELLANLDPQVMHARRNSAAKPGLSHARSPRGRVVKISRKDEK